MNFTIDKGLKIQAGHLAQWKKVLNKKTYVALSKMIEESNKVLDPKIHTGFHVFRGQDMTSFVIKQMED